MASTASGVVSVEIDQERSEAAAAALADVDNVELLVGDWREHLPPRGPFGLLFLDAGGFKEAPGEVGSIAIGLLEPGGLLVADDMTPGLAAHDRAREWLLGHPDLVGAEILTTPSTSALIGARR